LRRKSLNILLIIITITIGGLAVWLSRRPPLVIVPELVHDGNSQPIADSAAIANVPETLVTQAPEMPVVEIADRGVKDTPVQRHEDTRIADIELRTVSVGNPFRLEAAKVLSGSLEENDSLSRHRILNYCEHLRASYTTRDIDFIKQVFSDNALIIVGQVVQTAAKSNGMLPDRAKVEYIVRSKKAYVEKLDKIFKSGKKIDVQFSDFKIMRHPTMDGIYGVTLRQKYQCGTYSDDGYLFLLWDFRDRSMPMIHVRTWQPTLSINLGDDDLIDIGDFNLE